jgi:hypothetical protein
LTLGDQGFSLCSEVRGITIRLCVLMAGVILLPQMAQAQAVFLPTAPAAETTAQPETKPSKKRRYTFSAK